MTTQSISIRWVNSVDNIPIELWAACFPPPLEGRWWYNTLEHCGIEDQFTFSYAIIEQSGQQIGIAPTFLMDVPLDIIAPDQLAALVRAVGKYIRPLRYQRTLFVGSPCSDEGTVGLVPGVSLRDIARPLQDALDHRANETKASMIVWKDFIDSDMNALQPMAKSHGMFRVVSFPGTRVNLPAGGYDGYLTSLKSSRRHQLKKKVRLGNQVLPTESSVVQHPDPAALAEIFSLFWQTYLKGKTKFEKLNLRFFQLIAAEPTSHFVLLRQKSDQKLVAFMLCLDCKPRAINKFIGIDYSHKDGYLYFQLWQAAAQWATRAGFAEVQSGQTGYSAKLALGHELVPMTNLCRHRNPLIHRIFRWQAKSINWKSIDHDLKVHLVSRDGGPATKQSP